MNVPIHVASPPSKPLMIFDGDCHFCSLWIKRWQQITGDAVDYLPLQDPRIAEQFPELLRERLQTAVHLVEPDGLVSFGAEAVFRALAVNPQRQAPLNLYRGSAGFAALSEWAYRFVAEHRTLFSWLTRIGWGWHVERPEQLLTRWVFLRGLGVIYLIAFVSLWSQIPGLLGHNGILPVQSWLPAISQQALSQGIDVERFWYLPTLCWFGASDASLQIQCAAGTALAILLIVGIAPAPCLFLLWLVYLSLCSVGREFLSFQWDSLLLETGFLAILFAPLQIIPRPSREAPPSRLVLWLLRVLLFKLMFQSGCVKLLSGDELWRNLTALTVHYETQPLPTWIGWWAHQLPMWFQKLSCVAMFAIELVVPFLIFAPRRLRFTGAGLMILLQVLIFLTGNYTFFNLLTILLCLLSLDDFYWGRITLLRSWFTSHPPHITCRRWPCLVTVPIALVILSVTLVQLVGTFGVRSILFEPVAEVYGAISPFRSVNSYGLFAVMTRPRNEIIVEGSNDGQTWQAYEFKYKPGDVKRRPGFVAPHQPRLDWQMWFAALSDVRSNPWFINFCVRLLQGTPEVLALLERNPFPDKSPRYIRAMVYEYRFTSVEEYKSTGAWWHRELKGEYLPAISLNNFRGE